MKHFICLVIGVVLSFIISCSQHQATSMSPTPNNAKPIPADLPKDSGSNTPKYKMGTRIRVSGDYNGDGRIDTVYESYISALTGAETYKDMDSTDWEGNINAIIKNKPVSRLYTDIKGVDTFVVTNEPQLRGLMALENLGNIYGGKGDELGFVIDWADYSNMNTYHIITLSRGKWREVYSFPIHESINFDPENLFDNVHTVKALSNGRIEYKYYDKGDLLDTIVTL